MLLLPATGGARGPGRGGREEPTMKPTRAGIGTVIAERTLHWRDSPERKVVVSLGKPRRTRGTPDWECPFRIHGVGIRGIKYGRGVDAFQAVTTSLQGIRYFLDRSGIRLAWTGIFDDQTGFQQIMPLLPEADVGRRLERLVEREMKRRLDELRRRHERGLRRTQGGHPRSPRVASRAARGVRGGEQVGKKSLR
jgi:hypothetical protein